ncbi:MAG: dienelactone hydrolase family protein [Actinobacteria bacterium]|nr:dienelactone hydrolase family protein [Actinomycetota bacterium]
MRTTLPSGTPAEVQHVPSAPYGLVVHPDMFGLRPLFDDHVRRFAEDWGMSTVAIEPFPNLPLGATPEDRMAAMSSKCDSDVFADLQLAAELTGCATVRMIGFCMGGMYAFKVASTGVFDRIVSVYGMISIPEAWRGPEQGDPLSLLTTGDSSSVLAILGGRDVWTPEADIARLRETEATIAFYAEGEHGFAHDPSRPAHRAADAEDAFVRARNWLTR